jgi:hypothetical protein
MCVQEAAILDQDYKSTSAELNRKFDTTADARERAAKLAARATKILEDTLKKKNQLQGGYTLAFAFVLFLF